VNEQEVFFPLNAPSLGFKTKVLQGAEQPLLRLNKNASIGVPAFSMTFLDGNPLLPSSLKGIPVRIRGR